MRRLRFIGTCAVLFFITALIIAVITSQETAHESEFVKSFRDPDRVDQRWLYVAGFGAASLSFMLWSMSERERI